MKRIQPLLLTALLFVACNAPDHSEEIAKLTQRVEALEKRAANARPQRAQRPQRPDPKQTYFLPVRSDDPYRGAEHAKVTIVEAYEFACPYCALIEPLLADIIDEFKGTDTVKVVSKQFVVHPELATDAALATCAAHQQGKFEAFAEKLWAESWAVEGGRPRMKREQLKRNELLKMAKAVGLDEARFTKDLDGATCKGKLKRDRADLAKVGVRGTPYLFINGRFYTGGRSLDALRRAVQAEVGKADKALAGGAKLATYYDDLMKTAKRSL